MQNHLLLHPVLLEGVHHCNYLVGNVYYQIERKYFATIISEDFRRRRRRSQGRRRRRQINDNNVIEFLSFKGVHLF